MKKNIKKIMVIISTIGLFTLACSLLNLGDVGVPAETLTPSAIPIEETPENNATQISIETATSQAANTQEIIPQQTEPSSTESDTQNILGVWRGTAQWLCDTNPIWSTNLEFRSNGFVSASLSTTTEYASADGSWSVYENEISIQFERGLWLGTISGNTISGTFTEENCNGVWSVSKD